MGQNE